MLDLSGVVAMNLNKKRITPHHIQLAIHGDEELKKLLNNVTIIQGGVTPYLHPELLKTRSSKTHEIQQHILEDEDAQRESETESEKEVIPHPKQNQKLLTVEEPAYVVPEPAVQEQNRLIRIPSPLVEVNQQQTDNLYENDNQAANIPSMPAVESISTQTEAIDNQTEVQEEQVNEDESKMNQKAEARIEPVEEVAAAPEQNQVNQQNEDEEEQVEGSGEGQKQQEQLSRKDQGK
jgi:hypothetical protein